MGEKFVEVAKIFHGVIGESASNFNQVVISF
jgi:hypothetical protein